MDNSPINVSSTLWAFLGYFVFRFLFGKISIVILVLACLLLTYRVLFKNAKSQPLIFWAPTLLLAFSSLAFLSLTANPLATYALFTFFAIFLHGCGYTLFKPVPPNKIIPLALVFIVTVFPFIVNPDLSSLGTQPIDNAAEIGAGLRKLNKVVLERESVRAYFFHGAELGQFAACIVIVLSQSFRNAIDSEQTRFGSVYILVEIAIYALLILVVYESDSSTSKILVLFALSIRYVNLSPIALVPVLLIIIQFLTQLVTPGAIALLLQSGSFWWRYKMAESVMSAAPAFSFSPTALGAQSNWTHSIFLDFAVAFGVAGPLVLFANQILMVFVPRYRNMALGWSCLFMVIAAIQPVGASAVYIVIAFSLTYGECVTANRRITRLTRSSATDVSDPPGSLVQ